jgi:excisionase family DNA binding protein
MTMRHYPQELVGTGQAARILGLSYRHVDWLIHKGLLPAVKVGRTWAVPLRDVERLARERQGKPRRGRPPRARSGAEGTSSEVMKDSPCRRENKGFQFETELACDGEHPPVGGGGSPDAGGERAVRASAPVARHPLWD